MDPNTNRWNRLRYDLYAPIYDLVARPTARGRRRSIELLRLKPGERILIVGAGTGLDLPYLPEGIEVTAIDLSPRMLEKAARRAARLGMRVTLREMDAHRLQFEDGRFDAVILHLFLAVVPDPHAAIREVARVLRPGGRVGIFDKFLPDGSTASRLRRAIGVATNVLFSDINRQLGPLLREAGLERVHEEPSILGGVWKVVLARRTDSGH